MPRTLHLALIATIAALFSAPFLLMGSLPAALAQETEESSSTGTDSKSAQEESPDPGVSVPEEPDPRITELHDAARQGDLATVRKLLVAGVPVDGGNHYEVTALMYASGWGHADVVSLLLEKGADLDHTDNLYGANAMTWAADRGHADVINALVANGADPEAAFFNLLEDEHAAALEALIGSGKISQEILDAGFARTTIDGSTQAAAVLKKAGGKLPPPSDFTLSEEALAAYVGTYAYEPQPDYRAEVTLEDGRLVTHISGGDPVPLEPLDELRFREARSTFIEVRFERRNGALSRLIVDPINTPASFIFVRQKAPETPDQTPDQTPDTAEGSEATNATATAEADTASPAPAGSEPTTEKVVTPPRPTTVPKGVADGDWTAFRGPGGAGTAQGDPVLSWDVETGENILWKTPIVGRSHASPIVSGNKIFLATVVSSAEEIPFRTGNYGDPDFVENEATYSWRLLALHRETGKILWERTAHEGKPRAKHHIKATQMNATPVTDGRHVVAVMGSEGLFCYDHDGNLLWKRDLGKLSVGWFYDDGFEWGHSSSPILYRDRVILQVDRARDPFIAAYSLKDGREIWRTSRDNIPSWGTPALLEGPEGTEIVTNGSRKIRGYDADSGEELWSLGPHSEVTVGSVVTGHGLAFAVGDWQPIRSIYAIRPGGRGDISLADGETANEHIAWHYPRGGTYVPSPLVYGDHFYTLSNNGILGAYDAKTGHRHFRARVAGGSGAAFSASPIAATGRLYIASEDGDVYVVSYGEEFELLSQSSFDEIIMATPAIGGDTLFVRTLENLYAIGKKPLGAKEE